MKFFSVIFLFCITCLGACSQVVINEIMYHHPDSELEFIELYHAGDEPVSLQGWSIKDDQDDNEFIIEEAVNLSPQQYLIIANDSSLFQETYGFAPDLGGIGFNFSNSGDWVRLYDARGNLLDTVRYDDREPYSEQADGHGASLERTHELIPATLHQAWAASADGGSPGEVNQARLDTIPPIIVNLEHFPKVPQPGQTITVVAEVLGLEQDIESVDLRYAWNSSIRYESVAMFDDGQHEDGAAGDGVFGTEIESGQSRDILKFYVEANDAAGQSAALPDERRLKPYLAVVENTLSENVPVLRMVMEPDVQERFLARFQTDEYFPASLYVDDEAYYQVDVRHRGRSRVQNGRFKIRFPFGQLYRGKIRRLNLNGTDTGMMLREYLSFQLYHDSGIPNLETELIRFHINGESTRGIPYRVAIENPDAQFLKRRHFFENDDGNLYKTTLDGTPQNKATWRFMGDDPYYYNETYIKQTNEDEADYSDIIEFCKVLSEADTFDPNFMDQVYSVLHVENFIRWMAVSACVAHWDSPYTDHGHNYVLYHNPDSKQFNVIAWDLNGTFRSASNPNDIGYRKEYTHIRSTKFDAINKILNHPYFGRLYYQEIYLLMNTIFSPDAMEAKIDTARTAIKANRNSVGGLYAYVNDRNRDLAEWINADQGLAFISKPNYQAYVNELYQYRCRAVNYFGFDPIAYELVEAPEWLTINAKTGDLTGMPSQEGEFEVVVSASSGREEIEQTFTLQVTNPLPRLLMNITDENNETIIDLSRFENHGNLVDNSRRQGSPISLGSLNASNDVYIRVPHHESLDLTGAITVEAWIRPNSIGNGNPVIITKGNQDQYNYKLMLGYGPFSWDAMEPGFMPHPFDIQNRAYYGRKEIEAQLTPRQWVHIAGTYDSAQEKVAVYVNNFKIVDSAARPQMPINGSDLFIGYMSNGFSGGIDGVKVLPFAKTEFAAGVHLSRVAISNFSIAQDQIGLSLDEIGLSEINTGDYCLHRPSTGEWVPLPEQILNAGEEAIWWVDELGFQSPLFAHEHLAVYPIESIGNPSAKTILDQVAWDKEIHSPSQGDENNSLSPRERVGVRALLNTADPGVQAGLWLPNTSVAINRTFPAVLTVDPYYHQHDSFHLDWAVEPQNEMLVIDDIEINNGEPSTTEREVTLQVSVDSVSHIRFGESPNHLGDWQTYSPTNSWTLSEQAGEKIIYVQVKDTQGRRSHVGHASINYQTTVIDNWENF